MFPSKISTFVDLFAGGFNVGINAKADMVIYNDNCIEVAQLMHYLAVNDTQETVKKIENYIQEYSLSKENRDGYLKLRESYNHEPDSIKFYTLVCYSFNNQIRFNSKGEYNMPFGKNKSSFNPALKQKFINFTEKLHEIPCEIYDFSFKNFPFFILSAKDFVYCDPPYLNSSATYNENNSWNIDMECELLNLLDNLDRKNIKWALSNNLKYNNIVLGIWKNKYNVHYLDSDYSNCNYHKKDRTADKEVLITNY